MVNRFDVEDLALIKVDREWGACLVAIAEVDRDRRVDGEMSAVLGGNDTEETRNGVVGRVLARRTRDDHVLAAEGVGGEEASTIERVVGVAIGHNRDAVGGGDVHGEIVRRDGGGGGVAERGWNLDAGDSVGGERHGLGPTAARNGDGGGAVANG